MTFAHLRSEVRTDEIDRHEEKTYMQMLFRQTDPLEFSPNPVVSSSSLKFGGPSHSSSSVVGIPSHARTKHITLTIAIELTRTTDSEKRLA